ncbi:MAG: hypothetical protein KCHDKBKB_02530 [Elusimicrobia bacterium]|nr:hypothetical protein [Elusimicrobiota bacterium]
MRDLVAPRHILIPFRRSWGATHFLLLVSLFLRSPLVLAADYQKIQFGELSDFLCDPDNPNLDPKDRTCEIPDKVKALDKKMISIQGFMIPLEGDEEGRIKTFVLVKDQMSCCFGGNPRLNAWIFVKMKDKKFADYVDFVPITVSGQFEVGMSKLEGQVSCLYRMEGEIVKAAKL